MKKLFVLILGFLLFTCDKGKESNEEKSVIQETTESNNIVEEDDSIYIGVIAAKTGSASDNNKVLFNVVNYAINEINNTGGILGKNIKILEYDNNSTSIGSKIAAEKAVKDEVIAVVGPARSSFALASAPVLQEAGIPTILPTSTNPKTTLVGDAIFRMVFLDSYQGEVLANFSYNTLNAKKAVVLVNTNRVYSMDLADFYIENFKKLGGEILASYDYLDTETDYKEFINNTIKLDPDIVFIPSESRDVGFIIRQAQELGLDSTFIGSDSWSENIFEFSGDIRNIGYYTTFWHRDLESSIEFVKKYEKVNPTIHSAMIPLTYDSVMLLKHAILKANSFNSNEIITQLKKIDDFKGISGDIEFDINGDPKNKGAVILELVEGEQKYIKYVH